MKAFSPAFELLTGHAPFPWQQKLYDLLVNGSIPSHCNLPTGLGKTSIIPIWLLALAAEPDKLPRRLVYVVNRRTVVDQTTAEVEKLRKNLNNVPGLAERLNEMCAGETKAEPLAISTLRGQFADNQEWSADPARPAVICGTVDMIGSRLLFGGYRIGFKSRPLHAGFLGQDALLVHDEAHLEPAFQKLIEEIEREQSRERNRGDTPPWPKLHVMALSATQRNSPDGGNGVFGLAESDRKHPIVTQRIGAPKALRLRGIDDEKKLVDKIAELALQHADDNVAVLVFARTIDSVNKIRDKITDKKTGVSAEHVQQLTGTMRGLERDGLVRHPAFIRFLPESDRPKDVPSAEGTVYLVCTSAGEVGVNLSADHMVCDLSTFESMAQRLGRVNRFGDRDNTCVDVVHPTSFDDKHKLAPARKATLQVLESLNGDASPAALEQLDAADRLAAFAPAPQILSASDILFDAWALTTIRDKMPGRPPVAPYLHGVAEWEPPRTSVAWREDVEHITKELIDREGGEDFLDELLADYPLKPHELLSDTSERILESLQQLAERHPKAKVWLVNRLGEMTTPELRKIADPEATQKQERQRMKEAIADGILLLPPNIGGLTKQGTLDGKAPHASHPNGYDIADQWLDEENNPRRLRQFSEDARPADGPAGMTLIRTIDTKPSAEEFAPLDEEAEADSDTASDSPPKQGRFWHWYARPRNAEDATHASARPVKYDPHVQGVAKRAAEIVEALNLPDGLKEAIKLAAEWHDLGKKRNIWQRSIGNPDPSDYYAKGGKPPDGPRWRPRRLSGYRHELGSLLDVMETEGECGAGLAALSDDMKDVVLHLIAAHHGYARPYFPPNAFDHEKHNPQQNEAAAREAMRRYARLQRRYGRWGLAYLESLLRAADWAASASESEGDA